MNSTKESYRMKIACCGPKKKLRHLPKSPVLYVLGSLRNIFEWPAAEAAA